MYKRQSHQVPIDPDGLPVLTLDATTLLGSFSDPTAVPFDATTAATTPLYLTFDLDAASTAALGTLSSGTLYAFTITSSSTTDPSFRIERSLTDDFADGNGIFTNFDGIPTLRGPDDALFFLQGTIIGAPQFPLGDVDCSGEVDFLDIGPLIALLSEGGFSDKADVDQSEAVDFLDIGPFIALLCGS